jgi:lipid biosynthesis B12-binding/radical SAM protein
MKIALVSSNTAVTPYPTYPLGLSMIASALTNAGHEVCQVDFLEKKNSLEALAQEIRTFGPELIGISIRNIDNVNLVSEQYYIGVVKDIVKKIREVSAAKIILGGAGFSLVPDLILRETEADYGIVGEGEVLIVDFAGNAAKGIYPEERLIHAPTGLSGTAIPSALYDERLMSYYLQSGHIAAVQTKRGCTHKCVYCSYPLLEGTQIRKRDAGQVVDDIEALRDKHNAKYIFFVDSVFNDDEGAYLEIMEEMIRRKVSTPWTGFFQPLGLNDEIMEMMRQTGLVAAEIGSDAACDITLRKMGKRFTFQDIVRCNDLFVKHKVAVSHFYMFGGPGETRETVFEGIENIKGLKGCVVFIFMGIRLLPNTPLARIAVQENLISSDQEMLKPLYYLSPATEREWLEETLTKAFADVRHCIFPSDAFDSITRVLHKTGYTGTLWDMLLKKKK